mgnify:CR=1 FL=1
MGVGEAAGVAVLGGLAFVAAVPVLLVLFFWVVVTSNQNIGRWGYGFGKSRVADASAESSESSESVPPDESAASGEKARVGNR